MTTVLNEFESNKVKKEKLTIDHFFMGKDEYNELSETDREITHRYINSIVNDTEMKSSSTIHYNVVIMRFVLRNVKNNLNNLTIDDIDDIKVGINQWKKALDNSKSVSQATKKQYFIGIKRFLYWYANRYKKPEYLDLAHQIKVSGKYKRKNSKDMLTDSEIKAMIKTAINSRDKAIIATLAESGCRIGEILNCKIGDVTFHNNGCDLNISKSKTPDGIRIVPLGSASYYLENYIIQHPLRSNPKAPLWVNIKIGNMNKMKYQSVYEMIKKVAEESGVTKRIHPHLFRHSAATSLSKTFNEFELKKFMGWHENSTVPSNYIHLDDEDIKFAVYSKRYGLVEIEKNDKEETGKCPRCGVIMPTNIDICQRCKFVVNPDLRSNIEKREQVMAEMLAKLDQNAISILINALNNDGKIKH
jgi:integrase/recombinase XerD